MEEKKRNESGAELTDETLGAVNGGIKIRKGLERSTWCSACGKDVTPDDYGCCPDCGKRL